MLNDNKLCNVICCYNVIMIILCTVAWLKSKIVFICLIGQELSSNSIWLNACGQ